MPSGATYPAEGHSRIDNSWLTTYADDKNAVWYCEYKDGKDPDHYGDATGLAKMPRGIIIRSDGSTDGASAVVRGYLWDETSRDTDDYYLTAGAVHPLRFKRVYARGTTARGVKILY